jgi:hypothetical protein
MASSWSMARLVHPSEGRLCHRSVSAAEPSTGQCSAHHIVHNIRSGGRFSHWLALFVAVVLHTHIHTTGMRLLCLGSLSWSRHRHLSTLYTWNWGPQLRLRLHLSKWRRRQEAAMCGWTAMALVPRRWRDVAAMVFIAHRIEIM